MKGVTIIPLGTSGAVPIPGRHLTSFAMRTRKGNLLLFDCGEGTQFRLQAAGLSLHRIRAVFITHFHGDHIFGLPGILNTMKLQNRKDLLTIVSPAGLHDMMMHLPGLDDLPFEIIWLEIPHSLEGPQIVYEAPRYSVTAAPLRHSRFTVGYRYQRRPYRGRVDAEKAEALGVESTQFKSLTRGESIITAAGRTVHPEEIVGEPRPGEIIAFCWDTTPCEGARLLAADADLVIHEATFADEHQYQAEKFLHSSARDAATTARDAGAKRLLLTHFSARYREPEVLLPEAREVFPATDIAEELKEVFITSYE